MSNLEVGLVSLLGIVLLVYAGLYVSIALMLCSFLGVWAIKA